MISSGINPNVGIEEQEYCITKLGYINYDVDVNSTLAEKNARGAR